MGVGHEDRRPDTLKAVNRLRVSPPPQRPEERVADFRAHTHHGPRVES